MSGPPEIDERAKRVRSLLSSYYGTDASDDSRSSKPKQEPASRALSIDAIGFDLQLFMGNLVQGTRLDGLLSKHVEMAQEIKNLDSDMQMLVYENYNKFISATDTIRRMKENVSGMETRMEQLLATINGINEKSDGVNSNLAVRRAKIEELNGVRGLLRKMQVLFDTPDRLRSCLKNDLLEIAVHSYLGAKPMLDRYESLAARGTKAELEGLMLQVQGRLKTKMMDPSTRPEEAAEYARLLQMLDPAAGDLQREFLNERCKILLRHLAKAAKKAWECSGKQFSGEGPPSLASLASELGIDKCEDLLEPEAMASPMAPSSPGATIVRLNQEFFADFLEMAHIYVTLFPRGDDLLAERSSRMFLKYFAIISEVMVPSTGGPPPAASLMKALGTFMMDVGRIDEVTPKARLAERAAQTVEATIRWYLHSLFLEHQKKLIDSVLGGFSTQPRGAVKAVGASTGEGAAQPPPPAQGAPPSLADMSTKFQTVFLEGAQSILRNLQLVLEDLTGSRLLASWRETFIDMIQGLFQSLFINLEEFFLQVCGSGLAENAASRKQLQSMIRLAAPFRDKAQRDSGADGDSSGIPPWGSGPAPSGCVLLSAHLCFFLEEHGVPHVMELLAASIASRGPGSARKKHRGRPAFSAGELIRILHGSARKLLAQYVMLQGRKLSLMVRKSVGTPNWLKVKEPRDVRPVTDLFCAEVVAMEQEVSQLLRHATSNLAASKKAAAASAPPSRRAAPAPGDSPARPTGEYRASPTAGGPSAAAPGSMPAAARPKPKDLTPAARAGDTRVTYDSNLTLERDVAKLFSQKITIFGQVEFKQDSIIIGALKIGLKSFYECARLETFCRSGYQQIQLDTFYLRMCLHNYVDASGSAVVDTLVDEINTATAERCLDPVPLQLSIVERILTARMANNKAAPPS